MIDLSNDSTSSSDAENECGSTNSSLNRAHPTENVENMKSPQGKNINILRQTTQFSNERQKLSTVISNQSSVSVTLRFDQNSVPVEKCKVTFQRQIRMLNLKILSLEKEIRKYQSDEVYNFAVHLIKKQKLKIHQLTQSSQEWELKYNQLEKKYEELSKEKARAKQILKIVQPDDAQQEEENHKDIFNIDFKDDTDESFPADEENDIDVDEMVNYEVKLSERDFEIRRQKTYLQHLEERFKHKEKSEKVIKRKLKDMECEKELADKRLKVVEEEKEKLVDELEYTTLCGFCEDNPKNIVFDPCGHIWACEMCVSKANLFKCPSCREEIKNVRKVFIS